MTFSYITTKVYMATHKWCIFYTILNVFKWDTVYVSTLTQINITNILVVVVVVVVVDVAASCKRCITFPHTEGTLNPSLQPAELPQLYRSYRSLHPSSTPAREPCRTSSNSELINGSDAFIVVFYLQKSTFFMMLCWFVARQWPTLYFYCI